MEEMVSHLLGTKIKGQPSSAALGGASGGLGVSSVSKPSASKEVPPLPGQPSLVSAEEGSRMDHRSICRLAWAFSVSNVTNKAAWDLLLRSASSSIDALTTVRKGVSQLFSCEL